MTTYNVYRRNTVSDTPVAIATGLTSKSYSDTTGAKSNTYLYSVGAEKNGIEKVSSEISKLAGIPWTPNDLTQLSKLWLSSESIIKDSSNRISQVNDLSSSGGNATQSTDSLKPVLLSDRIHFDGADDYMNLATLNLFQNVNYAWMFAVVSKNTLDTSDIERPVIMFSTSTASFRVGLTVGNTVAGNKNKICFGGRRLDADSYDGVASSFQVSANRDI